MNGKEPDQKSLHPQSISRSCLRKPEAGVKVFVAKQQGNLWRKRDIILQYFTDIYRLSGVNESFGIQTPFKEVYMQTGIARLHRIFRTQQMSPSVGFEMPWKMRKETKIPRISRVHLGIIANAASF